MTIHSTDTVSWKNANNWALLKFCVILAALFLPTHVAANPDDVSVSSFQYHVQPSNMTVLDPISGIAQRDNRLSLDAVVQNRNSKTLRSFRMRCTIIANEAFEIYRGILHGYPDLIGGSSGRVELRFEDRSNIDRFWEEQRSRSDRWMFMTPAQSVAAQPRPNQVSSILVNSRQSISSLSLDCAVIAARFF